MVSVKIFLLLSSTSNAPGLSDGKTYSYADRAGITFSDSKKRRLFSAVARLTNVSIKRSWRMNKRPLVGSIQFRAARQRGAVLIVALMMLLVMTDSRGLHHDHDQY